MILEKTSLEGLLILKPKVHRDERGFFLETYRKELFQDLLPGTEFIQDNHAMSAEAGILRGLHFQHPPAAQAKLVWVTRGAVFDVAVDLRKNSATYGQWFGLTLNAEDFTRLFIPRGFAHGYMTTRPDTEFMYKVDNYYSPEHDAGIVWNDPALSINWPSSNPILSAKDCNQQSFKELISPFD